MTVSQILALVISAIQQLGLTPYIQAGLLIVVIVATLIGLAGALKKN